MNGLGNSWGAYIHIPFCLQKCGYCDFNSYVFPENVWDDYIGKLTAEIRFRSQFLLSRHIDSIFFGGGTPSLLGPDRLGLILDVVARYYEIQSACEITFEVNPETISEKEWALYSKFGFNRASVGVQSFQKKELLQANRIHSAEQARRSIIEAQTQGFERLNIDLIYGLPGQTLDSLQKTLTEAVALPIDHLSIYGLQLEEGTSFYELEKTGKLQLPSMEEEESMYDWIQDYLPGEGFERYEISNFSKAGKESRHNLKYWGYQKYLGFGMSACGFDGTVRLSNPASFKEYSDWVKQLGEGKAFLSNEMISLKSQMEEFCFMGFRTTRGISSSCFLKRFGSKFEEVYEQPLKDALNKRWLIYKDGNYLPTSAGLRYNNLLGQLFLLD